MGLVTRTRIQINPGFKWSPTSRLRLHGKAKIQMHIRATCCVEKKKEENATGTQHYFYQLLKREAIGARPLLERAFDALFSYLKHTQLFTQCI